MRRLFSAFALSAFTLAWSLDTPSLRAQDKQDNTNRYQRLFGDVNLSCPAKSSPREDCSFSLAKRPDGDKDQNLFLWGSFWQGSPKMGVSYLAAPGEANTSKRGVTLQVRGDAGGDRTLAFECSNANDPECHSAVVSVDADEFANSTQLKVTAYVDGKPYVQFVLPVKGLRDALNAAANPELR